MTIKNATQQALSNLYIIGKTPHHWGMAIQYPDMEHLLCNDQLKSLIKGNLAQFQRISHDSTGLRRAAVTLTVMDAPGASGLPDIQHFHHLPERATLILTKRPTKMNRHGGQWALPGGRVDQGETIEQAALRELEEEVGLELSPADILGKLDDFTTRSGFVMTPLVVWGGPNRQLTANPDEVESIHLIPIDEFMRKDAPQLQIHQEGQQPVLRMPIGNRGIFAPTGALLFQFREVAILGKDTRVAHFEQPGFAWK